MSRSSRHTSYRNVGLCRSLYFSFPPPFIHIPHTTTYFSYSFPTMAEYAQPTWTWYVSLHPLFSSSVTVYLTCARVRFDLFMLVLTIVFFCFIIMGVLILLHYLDSGIKSAKTALQNKGLTVSDKGVSVKTDRRFGREDYVDATQR